MNTHFWGPLFMINAALPHMRRQGEGRSSIFFHRRRIAGRTSPYSASKFALTGLSDGLRLELARENIVVTRLSRIDANGFPHQCDVQGRRPKSTRGLQSPIRYTREHRCTSRRAADPRRVPLWACRARHHVQAKLAILARTVAPELFADAMAMMNRLLPDAAGPDGNIARPGHESESKWAPSALTEPTYKAAAENNELP